MKFCSLKSFHFAVFFLLLANDSIWLTPPPTLGSDRPLQLVGLKITKSCRNMLEVAGQASQAHYHSICGEILPNLILENVFLD